MTCINLRMMSRTKRVFGELWAFKPAADGQMGTVMKAYREWLNCGDRIFLEAIWPALVVHWTARETI